MPFTVSHVAAALPFSKLCPRLLSMPGLIAGTMSPDFAYLLNLYQYSALSHSFMGIALFCAPLSVVTLGTLYALRRGFELCLNLPKGYFCQLSFIEILKFRSWPVLLSIGIGALSHIIWDSFTHPSGFFVTTSAAVFCAPFSVQTVTLPVFKWLQHLSTVAGFAAVAYYVYARHWKPLREGLHSYHLIRVVTFLGVCTICSLLLASNTAKQLRLESFAFYFAIYLMRIIFLSGCMYALILQRTRNHQHDDSVGI